MAYEIRVGFKAPVKSSKRGDPSIPKIDLGLLAVGQSFFVPISDVKTLVSAERIAAQNTRLHVLQGAPRRFAAKAVEGGFEIGRADDYTEEELRISLERRQRASAMMLARQSAKSGNGVDAHA